MSSRGNDVTAECKGMTNVLSQAPSIDKNEKKNMSAKYGSRKK